MKTIIYILIIAIFISCAPSRIVVPLGRKEKAVGLSAGGELINYNGSILPIPLSSFNYAVGIKKHLSAFGSLHLTPLLYGTYHVELGMLNEWLYHQKYKWGLTSNLVGNFMLTQYDWKFKFYPEFDMNFYWHFYGNAHYHCDCPGDKKTLQFVYAGFSSWYELAQQKSTGVGVDARVLINPHLGYSIGNLKNKYRLEVKYIAPWLKNDNTIIEYYNPFSTYGVIGVYLNYSRVL